MTTILYVKSIFLGQWLLKALVVKGLRMVFYLTKYYLDFVFINLYFVKYYLDSKSGKLPILCTVTVNLDTSISKLGRVFFHNNSYVRSTL